MINFSMVGPKNNKKTIFCTFAGWRNIRSGWKVHGLLGGAMSSRIGRYIVMVCRRSLLDIKTFICVVANISSYYCRIIIPSPAGVQIYWLAHTRLVPLPTDLPLPCCPLPAALSLFCCPLTAPLPLLSCPLPAPLPLLSCPLPAPLPLLCCPLPAPLPLFCCPLPAPFPLLPLPPLDICWPSPLTATLPLFPLTPTSILTLSSSLSSK